MARLRYNALKTGSAGSGVALALGASLTSSATSITFNAALTHSNGTAVPTLAGSDYIPLEICDASGNLTEIVYLTAYTSGGTTGTISRGQEGTTGVSHASGDRISHGPAVSDMLDVKDRRWVVGSGVTSIDEFNDDTLDAAWVRVDGANAPSGNVTWTEGADVVSSNQTSTTDTGNAFHALLRPLSAFGGALAAGDAVVAACHLFGKPGASHSIVGLVFTNGTIYGSGTQVATETYYETGTIGQVNATNGYTNFTTAGAGTGGGIGAPTPDGAITHMRLVYLGSNQWRGDRSPDGVAWLTGTVLTLAVTPTHVGFSTHRPSASGAPHIGSWEYIRRAAGVS